MKVETLRLRTVGQSLMHWSSQGGLGDMPPNIFGTYSPFVL